VSYEPHARAEYGANTWNTPAEQVQAMFQEMRERGQHTPNLATTQEASPYDLMAELSSVRQQILDADAQTRVELGNREAALMHKLDAHGAKGGIGDPIQGGVCGLCPACTACLLDGPIPDFEFVGAFLLVT
jgi:hypothetical protein